MLASTYTPPRSNQAAPPVVGRVYRGQTAEADTRRFAHQFADEIIARLSGGLAGIASTQIAFVSARSGNKEIWAMDYDGANQHQLTTMRSLALTPRWSPDASRIAFGFRLATARQPAAGERDVMLSMLHKQQSRMADGLPGKFTIND